MHDHVTYVYMSIIMGMDWFEQSAFSILLLIFGTLVILPVFINFFVDNFNVNFKDTKTIKIKMLSTTRLTWNCRRLGINAHNMGH